ncbi:MAG: family 2 glycosyl transferase [Paenibacillus sp.]|nr:family 2 glycosyl transferase [Paenibacillus sp.]
MRKQRSSRKSLIRKRLRPVITANRNSTSPKVSVIIPVVNERRTIGPIIANAFRVHRDTEVIVVSNGSTDGTKQIAERMGARVIEYPEALGHDVGRSLGAKEAKGSIILFLDGDIVIQPIALIPFVRAVENGIDVALNSYQGPTNKVNVHGVVLAKHALNIALSRPELKGSSLTTIPHAMSKKALDLIGYEQLVVPPKAQAIGIMRGLDIRAVHYVDVGRTNRIRKRKRGEGDPLESLIVGDHLEAIHWLTNSTNSRGNQPDLTRVRNVVR